MAAGLWKRAEDTLQGLLDGAKLKAADISAVEIVGGSSRVPMFKQTVQKVFGQEPSTTLNADEAVARGCALQCAILSPTFRVRDFSITDCQPYPITLNWQPQTQMEEDSSLEVFTRFHATPFSKMLTFYRKEPFTLSASYSSPADIPYPSTDIGNFKINNIIAQASGESSKVKVKVRVDSHGVFKVISASMYEKLEVEEAEEPKEMETDAPKDQAKVNGDQQPAGDMDTSAAGEAKTEESSSAESQAQDKSKEEKADGDSKEEDKKKEAAKKPKKTVKTIDLPVESMVHQLSRTDLNALTEKENQMVMQDKLEKERADAKNAVEEYVYDMRDKLYSSYENFITEDDRSAFSLKLEDTENWLYEDGEDENKGVYVEKLAELKKQGQPVADRYREAQEWPVAREEMGQSLMQVRKFLDAVQSGDEKFAHIGKDDVDKVEKLWTEKNNWFGSRMTQMHNLKPHQDPIVLASQVRSEKQILENTCSPIMTRPPPKVEPPKEEKKAEAAADTSNNAPKAEEPAPAADKPKEPETEMDID